MQISRKPDWLKVKLPASDEFKRVKGILSELRLHSVCQEALCPNIAECFHSGTATFLILGNTCTRNCLYCNVRHGIPDKVDETEPERLVQAVKELDLTYVVITSVTRDDLSDGGAEMFAQCVEKLRRGVPGCKLEVLIPDFQGNWQALKRVMDAKPDVINHNMEVVSTLFKELRPGGNYEVSLALLHQIDGYNELLSKIPPYKKIITKSGFMVGFGETWEDILAMLHNLTSVNCERVTVGQYQQPTRNHWPVKKYYHPDEFEVIRGMALEIGIKCVEAGPLVRSSYHAANPIYALNKVS